MPLDNLHCCECTLCVCVYVCTLVVILNMAVASGRTGRVLARPLFRELNVYMRTLKTREVICIRTSKPSRLGKQLPTIVQISLTKR